MRRQEGRRRRQKGKGKGKIEGEGEGEGEEEEEEEEEDVAADFTDCIMTGDGGGERGLTLTKDDTNARNRNFSAKRFRREIKGEGPR